MSLRVVIVALMTVTAIALGLIAHQIANPPRSVVAAPPPIAGPPMTSYLVATHAVLPGTLARSDDFTVKTVPVDKLPHGAVIDSPESRADLRGAMVRRYLDAGTPLTSEDLIRPKERGFLAAVLAPGTRAVSIGVDPVTGVAGLIWPGDHVDVILTQELDQGNGQGRQVTSESVLRNVRVIAVDQDIAQGAPSAGNATGHLASTVTIQATTDQAEKLAVAARLGHLSLAVRSLVEDTSSSGEMNGVTGTDVSLARARAGARLGPATGSSVEVIQGDQRSEVKFR